MAVDWGAECVLVWSTLERVQGDGYVPRATLAQACDRRISRISLVVSMIRDALPEAPLVSAQQGYRITGDVNENERYRLLVTSTCYTRLRRWRIGSAEPFFRAVAQEDPMEAARLRLQSDQMLATMEMAVRSHFRRNGGGGTL